MNKKQKIYWADHIEPEFTRRPKAEQIKTKEGIVSPTLKEKYHLDYQRKYKILTLILLFFTFSVIGWVWEVALHLVKDGVFINRGVLTGPWLPIYGTGGVLALILLKRFFGKPILTFFMIMVVSSAVEYFTSWFLEYTRGVRWWDYKGWAFNLNGRICLEGAVIFGLGGCAIVYFIAPLLAQYYERIPILAQIVMCVLLISIFVTDFVHSQIHPNEGEGITDYKEWKQGT